MAGISYSLYKLMKIVNPEMFFFRCDDTGCDGFMWISVPSKETTHCYDKGVYSCRSSEYVSKEDVEKSELLYLCDYKGERIIHKGDNSEYIERFSYKTTTADISAEKISVEAARKLMDMIDNPPEPTQEIVDLCKII